MSLIVAEHLQHLWVAVQEMIHPMKCEISLLFSWGWLHVTL